MKTTCEADCVFLFPVILCESVKGGARLCLRCVFVIQRRRAASGRRKQAAGVNGLDLGVCC